MKLQGQFNYLGIETFKGRKDPNQIFSSLALLQGTDVQKIFLDNDQLALVNSLNLKPMDSLNVTLDINIGTKTFVRLDGVEKINK